MKRIYLLLFANLLLSASIIAQERIIDAQTRTPVSAASIIDASGNMVGFTLSDGEFTKIPESAYPVTIRCLGYEQLVIERPANKTWEITPAVYDLEEVIIVPIERSILKQILYIREYFSLSTKSDTVAFFTEYMADRFIPASKEAKFNGNTSLRILGNRSFSRFMISDKDSVAMSPETSFPSMLSVFDLNIKKITAPESFKESGEITKYYEEPGKSGMSLIMKQNSQTFTTIIDGLADEKDHSISPWLLKAIGFSMEIGQLYMTHAYRVNENGIYLPKDLLEASFVMVADGKGKFIRKILNSDKPVLIHSMIELYVVDRNYLSKDEAKKEYKNKPENVEFIIPSTVPPLNEATQRMVERAKVSR